MSDELNTLKARLDALEEIVANAPAPTPEGQQAVTAKKPKLKVTGEPFTVSGKKYQAIFPKWFEDGKAVTEEALLSDKDMQKRLVESGSKLVKLVGALLLMLFAFASPAAATSVTINQHTAEVITTTTRSLYKLQELVLIYRASTDAFEVQQAETRNKLWGGDVDSVTISGASTTAAKLAFLRTLMLEATTTGGYRVFVGRSDVEYFYNTSTNRLDLKYGKNKQPLWFGAADSLQSGPSGAAAKVAFLRLINKWRSQDCLPTTSVATIAAGAAAGTSPTVTVTGDAFRGSITVTTGTSCTTGTLATVTLKITAPTGTNPVITPASDAATLHVARWKCTGTTTTLVITVPATALSDATAYTWNYHVDTY